MYRSVLCSLASKRLPLAVQGTYDRNPDPQVHNVHYERFLKHSILNGSECMQKRRQRACEPEGINDTKGTMPF